LAIAVRRALGRSLNRGSRPGHSGTRRLRTTRPCGRSSRVAVEARLLRPRGHRPPRITIGEVALIPADFGAHVDLSECRSFPLHNLGLSGVVVMFGIGASVRTRVITCLPDRRRGRGRSPQTPARR